jgi:hypothetical protein
VKSAINKNFAAFFIAPKKIKNLISDSEVIIASVVVFFEYLQDYGVIRIAFTIENAARINLIFRLANLLLVSLPFVHTFR